MPETTEGGHEKHADSHQRGRDVAQVELVVFGGVSVEPAVLDGQKAISQVRKEKFAQPP
jgi:hypothetical protein